MLILGIDPGPEESAWVVYDSTACCVTDCGDTSNAALLVALHGRGTTGKDAEALALEDFVPYGQRLSYESLRTVKAIGGFDAAWTLEGRGPSALISRPDVKAHLCGQASNVGDPDVRQALYERFGPGRKRAVGTKAWPGPLYGVTSHKLAALAVAVTWSDRYGAVAGTDCTGGDHA